MKYLLERDERLTKSFLKVIPLGFFVIKVSLKRLKMTKTPMPTELNLFQKCLVESEVG